MNSLVKLILITVLISSQKDISGQIDNSARAGVWIMSLEQGISNSFAHSKIKSSLSFYTGFSVTKEWFIKEHFTHGVEFRIINYKDKYRNLPYSYINEKEELESELVTQTNTYPILSLGWKGRLYNLKKNRFIQGNVGFGLAFLAKHRKDLNDRSVLNSVSVPVKNFDFLRPEFSIGLGFQKRLGELYYSLVPKVGYHLAIRSDHLVPSIGSVGLELNIYLNKISKN